MVSAIHPLAFTLVLALGCSAGLRAEAHQNPPEIKIGASQSAASAVSKKSKQQQEQEAAFDVSYSKAVALRRARGFEAASKQFQEAEQLAGDLTDTKYSWLQEVLAGEADCFLQLKEYEQAE